MEGNITKKELHAKVKTRKIEELINTPDIPESKEFSDGINEISDESNVSTDPGNRQDDVNENTEDPADEIQYTCNHCEKSYSKFQSYKKHLDTVHRGKSYVCTQCDETLKTSHFFTVHMMKHTGETYSCPKCKKSYSQLSNLKRHISDVHEGKKSHDCTKCKQSFTNFSHLQQHISSVHEEKKTHECTRCKQSFTRLYNFKRHLHNVHGSLRQHTHDHNQGVKQVYQHKYHDLGSVYKPLIYVQEHKGLNEFSCGECGLSFKTLHQCKLHMLFKSTCNKKLYLCGNVVGNAKI